MSIAGCPRAGGASAPPRWSPARSPRAAPPPALVRAYRPPQLPDVGCPAPRGYGAPGGVNGTPPPCSRLFSFRRSQRRVADRGPSAPSGLPRVFAFVWGARPETRSGLWPGENMQPGRLELKIDRRADSQWGCGFFGIGMTVWVPAPVLAKKIRNPSGTSLPGAAVSQRNGQKTRAKGGDHSTSRVCGQMESKHNSGAHAT